MCVQPRSSLPTPTPRKSCTASWARRGKTREPRRSIRRRLRRYSGENKPINSPTKMTCPPNYLGTNTSSSPLLAASNAVLAQSSGRTMGTNQGKRVTGFVARPVSTYKIGNTFPPLLNSSIIAEIQLL